MLFLKRHVELFEVLLEFVATPGDPQIGIKVV